MILHSIVPIESMQQMFADASSAAAPALPVSKQVLALSSTSMVEGTAEGGQFTVSRILSTDPNDYLSLFPGKVFPGKDLPLPGAQNRITYPHFL